MANQTASPNEAAVAREKLARLEAKPPPGVQVFVKKWRYVDLAAGKAVGTAELLTATRMWAQFRGIKVTGGFQIQSDDIEGVIRVSFLGTQGPSLVTPVGPADPMPHEHTSTRVRHRSWTGGTSASSNSWFGGIDFGAGPSSTTHVRYRRCICGSSTGTHSTICAQQPSTSTF